MLEHWLTPSLVELSSASIELDRTVHPCAHQFHLEKLCINAKNSLALTASRGQAFGVLREPGAWKSPPPLGTPRPHPHPQELTARYCGVRPPRPVRFPQVAVLSCCICCASCCWRRLCSLSFWVSANFTTIGEEQPCGQTQRKVKRGLPPGPLGSGHSVSVGPSFLNGCAAEGTGWAGV